MNFRINKNKLYNALTIASKAILSNSPVPALSAFKLELSKDTLLITASDANLSIQVTLNNSTDPELSLSVSEPGVLVIDARYLLDIVKKIDSSEIHIEIIDGTLTHFTGQKAEFRINGFRASEYPAIEFSEPAVKFNLEADNIQKIISSTAFAISAKDTRPVLTGINMSLSNGKLTCTGTDSFRLARIVIDKEGPEFMVTVPSKIVNEARNIFSDQDEVCIALSDKKIQFRTGTVIMQSTLLDGSYPDTERLIPTTFNAEMVISRYALQSAIDRSLFIRTDNMAIMRMQINSADDITISCKSQEIGDFNEDITAVSYSGIPMDISFSGNYMLDALKALSTDNVIIRFTENMKPFII
ncbi:MAG: DNA polymerase III subunit beta, partial [Solobacterium sp.]|nr:DNA polymerase III subunit beta [Solobacterium sp.]